MARLLHVMARFTPADGRPWPDPESPCARVVLVPTAVFRRRLRRLSKAARQAWSCVEVRQRRSSHYIE